MGVGYFKVLLWKLSEETKDKRMILTDYLRKTRLYTIRYKFLHLHWVFLWFFCVILVHP